MFIDVEHALDPTYAQRVGVDMTTLRVAQPSSGEEALEVADMLVCSVRERSKLMKEQWLLDLAVVLA